MVSYSSHNVPGQVSQRQATSTKCTFQSPLIDKCPSKIDQEKKFHICKIAV